MRATSYTGADFERDSWLEDNWEILLTDDGICFVIEGGWFERRSMKSGSLLGLRYGRYLLSRQAVVSVEANAISGVRRSIIGGGGHIFIYLCSNTVETMSASLAVRKEFEGNTVITAFAIRTVMNLGLSSSEYNFELLISL